MDINVEIFKRYKPEKKLEIIKNLTQNELFMVRKSTILRVIKEAGKGDINKSRNKFKTLRLKNEVGNNWNSTIESVYNTKGDNIFLNVYIQGDDTDTTISYKIDNFIKEMYENVIYASLHESFRNGYEHNVSASYNKKQRAEVIREILSTYIYYKYNIV